MKKPLIVLAGPTAVGKTDLSIKLAKAINGEIISADSVQVYKKLDIGSAKITKDEMQGVKHHLIDILPPDADFNVALFKDLVYEAVDKVYAAGKIPILAGGTGFYIQAILKDVNFSEGESDPAIREKYETLASEIGQEALHEKLKDIDIISYEKIPSGNIKRVVRALEYYEITGRPISEHNKEEEVKESPFDYRYFVLTDNRDVLYDRIDRRVDIMMNDGLLEEVKALFDSGIPRDAVSMQSLGYRQILDYLYNECTLEEAIYQIKLQTRHFAKRQLTWFKREKDVIWVDKSKFDRNDDMILEYVLSKCDFE